MGKKISRNVRWAKRSRLKLMTVLGNECKYCGDKRKKRKAESGRMVVNLEFHHTRRRSWNLESISRWMRMVKYWRDYREGIIVLACSACNKKAVPEPNEKDLAVIAAGGEDW